MLKLLQQQILYNATATLIYSQYCIITVAKVKLELMFLQLQEKVV